MSQIQSLLKQFKNNELDAFHFQQEVFNFYKKSPKTDEIKGEILNLVVSLNDDETIQGYMWGVFFESDREMHRKIELAQAKCLAEKSFKDNLTEPHPILLKSSASLAYNVCDRPTMHGKDYDKEIESVWLEVFKDVPEFKNLLEEEKKYWADFHNKTKEQYKDYYAEIEKTKSKSIVEAYEITVPVRFNPDNSKYGLTKEVSSLLFEIIDDFNGFGIEGYIDSFAKKCSRSSVISHEDRSKTEFIFKFECYEELTSDELHKAKEDFLGQLSDGWGENASQRKVLIGEEEVSLDFLTDKASDFIIKSSYNDDNNLKKRAKP